MEKSVRGIPGGALRLPQVLIKPRKTTGVHWWQREGGLLSLVDIKSTHPPLPIYDTLVTGMLRPGVGVDGKKYKSANIEGNFEKSV